MKVRYGGGGDIYQLTYFRGLHESPPEEFKIYFFFWGGGSGIEFFSGMDQIVSVYRIEIY